MISTRRILASLALSTSLVATAAGVADADTAHPMGTGYGQCLHADYCNSSLGRTSPGTIYIDFVLDNGSGTAKIGGTYCEPALSPCYPCHERYYDLPMRATFDCGINAAPQWKFWSWVEFQGAGHGDIQVGWHQ